ncbi:MAG: type II toxin-antitoxin system VapC family toxin [Deltaproteobacteria bacterium]|nr:type II toxin-antitoxin system VapC family toxin [Deltaproteobacteria bacterium]
MIFVDSNVPMYLIGQEHPHKRDTIVLLDRLASEKRKLVSSAEVFQELLHRYSAIHRDEDIQVAFDALYGLIEEIFPVLKEDVFNAKDLVLRYPKLSARDAVHAAQMKRLKIETVFSFDRGFDIVPGIKRIPQ